MNLAGGDLRRFDDITSAVTCQKECRKLDGCLAWTFVPERLQCYGKDTGHKDISMKDNLFSGPRDCVGRL